MKKYVLLLAVFALLSGCASSGNEKVRAETMDTVAAKVTKGKTTKDQVKAIYGEPLHVSLTDGGSEVWTYEYAHISSHAVNFVPIVNLFAMKHDVNKNEVVFIFDQNNVVQNYTVHASQTETGMGGKDLDAE